MRSAAAVAALQLRYPSRFNERLQTNIDKIYAVREGARQNQIKNKCPRCWLVPAFCGCAGAAAGAAAVTAADAAAATGTDSAKDIEVVVYMHWSEASARKASNTAKLVPHVLPQ